MAAATSRYDRGREDSILEGMQPATDAKLTVLQHALLLCPLLGLRQAVREGAPLGLERWG